MNRIINIKNYKFVSISIIVVVLFAAFILFQKSYKNSNFEKNSLINSNFNLTNQNGELVSHQNFYGKFKLVYFGFTFCPDVCPNTLNKISLAFDMIEKNFLFKFGNIGSNEGEFDGPFNISASSNQLFVVDSQNNRIQIFDSDGNFIKQFTTSVNSFSNTNPYDLKIYQNRIFILDRSDSSIQIFDFDGKFIKSFFIGEKNSNTSFTAIDVNKDLILIADSGNDFILIFDLDGNLLLKFGNNGNLYGQFSSPHDIVFDGKHIFISDNYNYRIQIFELFS